MSIFSNLWSHKLQNVVKYGFLMMYSWHHRWCYGQINLGSSKKNKWTGQWS